MTASAPAGRKIRALSIAGILALGVVRILLSYPAVSQTIDESSHIATGLEWLDRGEYTLNQENPPLARIAVALGPYLSGAVSGESLDERVQVLRGDAPYPRTLYLARLGTLAFFVAATLLVWALGVRLYDHAVGLVAALLFTMLPVVLGHSGVATTDMAVSAGVTAVILAFVLWKDRPAAGPTALLGLAAGLAVLSKFTALLFLGASGIAFLLAALGFGRGRIDLLGTIRRFLPSSVVALTIASIVVWAGFRFSVGPVRDSSSRPYRIIDRVFGDSSGLRDRAYAAIEAPIYPAPELIGGLAQMVGHSRAPHTTYLLGETRESGGFLGFFPVAFVVKTPIPFILLAGVGAVATIALARKRRDPSMAVPLLGAAAVMLSAMPSGVNVGIRHVLPIFPLLSVVAGQGVLTLFRSGGWQGAVRWGSVGLLAWCVSTSVLSHPDYLPYFNALAGPEPEEILADSDLDWGQDIGRLAEELRARRIEQVRLGLFTRAELDHFDWPPGASALEPGVPATGWIAASIYHIKVSGDFAWLEDHEPVDTIGSSIRLYFITGTSGDPLRTPDDPGR
jgi:4-amino-4-deoxy-L-arabinose transferase-like glycosyltransferase